jgi:cytochrome oxidase Cu insertion factor (SCO1/SenC/PrrC family)
LAVDPEKDVPERLRQFSKGHDLTDRWTLLTAKKENVALKRLLKKLHATIDD